MALIISTNKHVNLFLVQIKITVQQFGLNLTFRMLKKISVEEMSLVWLTVIRVCGEGVGQQVADPATSCGIHL